MCITIELAEMQGYDHCVNRATTGSCDAAKRGYLDRESESAGIVNDRASRGMSWKSRDFDMRGDAGSAN